jgi:hypothetical protein
VRPHFALALIVVIVMGVAFFERTTRFEPGPDTEVVALTTEPVRVHLGFSPDRAEIEAAVRGALEKAAATEPTPELAAELTALATDREFVANVAATSAERLSTDAAALAFSTTATSGKGDRITIAAITVEILPRGGSDGLGRLHEDGHAQINNGIVERCGAAIVAYEIEETGDDLMEAINDHIALLEERAHTQYHIAVTDQVVGNHGRTARRTLDAVEEAGCIAY